MNRNYSDYFAAAHVLLDDINVAPVDYGARLSALEEIVIPECTANGIETLREINHDDVEGGKLEFGYSMSLYPIPRGFNDDVLFESMRQGHKVRKFKS